VTERRIDVSVIVPAAISSPRTKSRAAISSAIER
jgi:hypothetical protein